MINEFNKNKTTRTGFHHRCKECVKETQKLYFANYYKRNKETFLKKCSNYKKSNEGKLVSRLQNRRRRARLKICFVEKYDEVEIYNQFDNRCFNCGSNEKLTIDHITPISKNGDDAKHNLCVLCGSCNSSKKDKYPEEFYSKEKLEKLYSIKGNNDATTPRNNHGYCD